MYFFSFVPSPPPPPSCVCVYVCLTSLFNFYSLIMVNWIWQRKKMFSLSVKFAKHKASMRFWIRKIKKKDSNVLNTTQFEWIMWPLCKDQPEITRFLLLNSFDSCFFHHSFVCSPRKKSKKTKTTNFFFLFFFSPKLSSVLCTSIFRHPIGDTTRFDFQFCFFFANYSIQYIRQQQWRRRQQKNRFFYFEI